MPAALLLLGARQADDVLFVSFYNHVPQARRLSRVPVEWAGRDAIATALDRIGPGEARSARVGVVGPLPFWHAGTLADRVADVVDLDGGQSQPREAGRPGTGEGAAVSTPGR